MTDQHPTTRLQLPSENNIVFSAPPTEEVLRLDKDGFHYRGQFIEDAGEARRLMVGFLRQGTRPALAEQPVGPTDEELRELYDEMRREPGGGRSYWGFLLDFARSVLARWGQPQ